MSWNERRAGPGPGPVFRVTPASDLPIFTKVNIFRAAPPFLLPGECPPPSGFCGGRTLILPPDQRPFSFDRAAFAGSGESLARSRGAKAAPTRCASSVGTTQTTSAFGRHNSQIPGTSFCGLKYHPSRNGMHPKASSIAPGHPLRRRLRESPRIAHPRSGGDLRDQVKADGLRNSGRGLGASTTFMACVCRRSATEMTRLATRSTRPCCSC